MPFKKRQAAFVAVLPMLALIGLGVLHPQAARAGQLPTGAVAGDMDLSPFYRWTSALPNKPGALLREEPMREQAEINAASKALRIFYTSEDVRWMSGEVPVSGVLYIPKGKAPAGGWPLLAWAHGTLGIADVCAPSWTGFRARDAVYINRWLEAGFAVVLTDYQGLGGPGPHPYLHWQAEGRSVLDSVRAARAGRTKLIANKVLIAGQSQGSGAALGAAKLARRYSPELKIVGVVATGLTSTFPNGPVPLPVRNSANMFLSFASGGLRDGAPPIEDLLSAQGKELLQIARQACTKEIGIAARRLKVGGLSDGLAVSLEELAAYRIPVTDMTMEPAGMPMLIGTGLADATTLPERQYAAVAALCASGDRVEWRRYEGLGHDGAMHGSFDHAVAFARARLRGRTTPSSCAELSPPGPPGPRNPNAPFNDD